VGTVALGALVAHAAPALAGVSPIGVRVTPRLVGVGRHGHVALSFDDGPDPVSTPEILAVLDDLGWRATFFMLGDMVRRHPGVARDVAEAGHEVAVHGDRHRNLLRVTPRATEHDVARAVDAVASASGVEPLWFRPPFGILSSSALRAASRHGMATVLWTTWGRDWRREATADSVVADVTRRYLNGGTILLHDADCESYPGSWKSTVGALPRLAEFTTARGLSVGPIGEHGIETARAFSYPP
jgi:peptidoglycan/xylan/chitin deacetylase (PgdA/CDA1 family)